MRHWQTYLAGIGLASLLAMAVPAAIAAEPRDSTISVTGTATAQVAPDQVTLGFGVEVQAGTAAAALARNSDLMRDVIDAIRQAGITEDEIATSQFNIYPVYEHRQDRPSGTHQQVLTGYRVSNMVSVDTGKLDRAAAVIDAAVAAGVNRVDRVAFGLSAAVRARLQDELIEAAVRNAREKAARALAPLGYTVTGVRQVSLADIGRPVPLLADAARAEFARGAPTQVFASDQEVQTTVNVTFLIGPE